MTKHDTANLLVSLEDNLRQLQKLCSGKAEEFTQDSLNKILRLQDEVHKEVVELKARKIDVTG